MFDNMYDTPQAYQDPFAGMSPADRARAQQIDIQLGGNGNGQALQTYRGSITPGSANFSQDAYDKSTGTGAYHGGQGGTDYGWAGNAINSGFRDFAKDPTGTLMGIDLPGMIENQFTGGIPDKMKNFARVNPMSLGNMFSTADNPDGIDQSPTVAWQNNIPAPPAQLTPREAPAATPAIVPPPPPPQQPQLREPPKRPTYGQEGGGWGWKGDGTAGGLWNTSRNGRDWTGAGQMTAAGAPPTAGWQQQTGTDTAPGDWTKPPGVK